MNLTATQRDDTQYLLSQQYRDASNLNVRIEVHQRFSTNRYGWTRWVFDHLRLEPAARILELGCGTANLWVDNLQRIPVGWNITLTDLSPGMVSQAQRNLDAAASRFKFEPVDAQGLPYPDAVFDAVIANHMLFHVADLDAALAGIWRVLRPAGKIYATTLGRDHLAELDGWYHRFGLDAFVMPSAGLVEAFGLETGASKLQRWFSGVALHCYADALRVTEVKPLIAHTRSTIPGDQVAAAEPRLAEFSRFIEQEITSQGAVHITKAAGLFEAVKEST